jgi:hypothetical protein
MMIDSVFRPQNGDTVFIPFIKENIPKKYTPSFSRPKVQKIEKSSKPAF